ncbi:hypothetical protein [Novosphingobium sp. 9U]|uniref:hypothetical protein n=1 Tax=Novosphingobium sp. 9U TaxID=2653158 RepID=UPI001359EEE7|nr:hypothetical protein [Novosphingobium sp. 9U]
MLRRLLAMLLLLALSAPALAMSGHCAQPPRSPQMHGMAHHGGDHSPAPQQERRDCIGCVLPDLGLIAPARSAPLLSMVGAAPSRTTLILPREGPEVPPPRA